MQLVVLVVLVVLGLMARPVPQRTDETPIAFWAWQASAPTDETVKAAIAATGARTLFLRAGQFHLDQSTVSRIRPVAGKLPRGIPLHLVYNATPGFLDGIERVTPESFGTVVGGAFASDRLRAVLDGAYVEGLQLDLDVPTRLLPRYATMLRAVRANIPPSLKLSVTGLPTWMTSPALEATLKETDFWIPQFYGAKIPDTIDSKIPISSPESVSRATARAREIGHPFFAGVAAYGYVIHYDRKGKIRSLRGDISPKAIARHPNFEFLENRPFSVSSFGRRVVFRVREDCVFAGLGLKTGESLVLDLPTAENLRACARAVRENGGDAFRGICVFRLPDETDPTVLTRDEIASALLDLPSSPNLEITGRMRSSQDERHLVELTIRNIGRGRTILSPDGLTVEIRVPEGAVLAVRTSDFDRIDALSQYPGGDLTPCGFGRANALRARASVCTPGDELVLCLDSVTTLGTVPIALTIRSENGDTAVIRTTVKLTGEIGP